MMRVLAIVLVAFALVGCSRRQKPAADPAVTEITGDTLVGRVAVVGNDPVTWVALVPEGGSAQVQLSGSAAEQLRAVSGAVVWVTGARESNGFRVNAFEVRRVNDALVDDGIVVVTASSVAIRTRSGEQRDVPNAPPTLRGMPGARIWVSLPVAGVAPSFGLIASP